MSNKVVDFKANSLVSKISLLFSKKMESPTVWTSAKAYHKINLAIATCTKEVGWFGLVDIVEGGYLITDIFVPKQDVLPTETDIKPEDIAELALAVDDPEKLIYWGHSHVNMGVSPSAQDELQTLEYLEHADIFIRGIYNKKGENKVDVFDVEQGVVHECVNSFPFIEPLTEEEVTTFKDGMKANITEYTYATQHKANKKGKKSNVTTLPTKPQTHKGNRILKYNPFIVKRTK